MVDAASRVLAESLAGRPRCGFTASSRKPRQQSRPEQDSGRDDGHDRRRQQGDDGRQTRDHRQHDRPVHRHPPSQRDRQKHRDPPQRLDRGAMRHRQSDRADGRDVHRVAVPAPSVRRAVAIRGGKPPRRGDLAGRCLPDVAARPTRGLDSSAASRSRSASGPGRTRHNTWPPSGSSCGCHKAACRRGGHQCRVLVEQDGQVGLLEQFDPRIGRLGGQPARHRRLPARARSRPTPRGPPADLARATRSTAPSAAIPRCKGGCLAPCRRWSGQVAEQFAATVERCRRSRDAPVEGGLIAAQSSAANGSKGCSSADCPRGPNRPLLPRRRRGPPRLPTQDRRRATRSPAEAKRSSGGQGPRRRPRAEAVRAGRRCPASSRWR